MGNEPTNRQIRASHGPEEEKWHKIFDGSQTFAIEKREGERMHTRVRALKWDVNQPRDRDYIFPARPSPPAPINLSPNRSDEPERKESTRQRLNECERAHTHTECDGMRVTEWVEAKERVRWKLKKFSRKDDNGRQTRAIRAARKWSWERDRELRQREIRWKIIAFNAKKAKIGKIFN